MLGAIMSGEGREEISVAFEDLPGVPAAILVAEEMGKGLG